GVPSMYFGLTSFVCWLELDKPADNLFNVAAYELPKEIRVLNLAIPQMMINGYSDDDNLTTQFISMIEIFPLIIATSFKVSDQNRSFKSEYIISQLVMQCLNEHGIDGIAYISKRVVNDSTYYPYCVNLAVPMKNN